MRKNTALWSHENGKAVWIPVDLGRNLIDYRTGCIIRPATGEELDASLEKAAIDGGHGLIEVEIDGAMVSCFCD